jgi:hypothetical protein
MNNSLKAAAAVAAGFVFTPGVAQAAPDQFTIILNGQTIAHGPHVTCAPTRPTSQVQLYLGGNRETSATAETTDKPQMMRARIAIYPTNNPTANSTDWATDETNPATYTRTGDTYKITGNVVHYPDNTPEPFELDATCP